MKYRIRIKPDGSMEFLGDPPPGFPLHERVRRRFSEVVPARPDLFILFRILRLFFGETGRVSNWTRRWPVHWVCIIHDGPRRGTFRFSWNRQELLKWEEQVWMTHLTNQ